MDATKTFTAEEKKMLAESVHKECETLSRVVTDALRSGLSVAIYLDPESEKGKPQYKANIFQTEFFSANNNHETITRPSVNS